MKTTRESLKLAVRFFNKISFLCAVLMTNLVWAQVDPLLKQKAGSIQFKQQPKLQIVKPDGTKLSPSNEYKIEKKTEWIDAEQTTQQYLSRKGVLVNQKTIEAFKTLNPSVMPDGTIPLGSKISVYTVDWQSKNKGLDVADKTAIDYKRLIKHDFSEEVTRAEKIKFAANRLSIQSFEKQEDFQLHKSAIANIEKSAKLIELNSSNLPSAELALSKYYLAAANASAQKSIEIGTSNRVSEPSMIELRQKAAPLQNMQMRLSSGQSPFAKREVVISVKSELEAEIPPRLRVYIIPAGFLDDDHTFKMKEIKDMLEALTFEGLTSPAKGLIYDGAMYLWLGADYQYESMAKLIFERRLTKYTPINSSQTDSSKKSFEFFSPSDVVKP